MSESQKHLVITAAGTGGHVMPGLAVAREMRARGWKITWIGTQTGMESKLVAKDGIDFIGLDFQGVRGKGLMGMVTGAVKLWLASRRSKKLLRELDPDVVFTTGGYICVPVSQGVKSTRKKFVVMNCDADILMSTNMVLKYAWAVACGFAGSARSVARNIGSITGNPVRADISALPHPQERLADRQGKLRILVFGGSLGARVLNETIPQMLAMYDEKDRPEVLHQCGMKQMEEARGFYEKAGVVPNLVGFIDDMAKAYADADIVICRSGATSVAELCAAGCASILVPFVAKTTSHQVGNAKYMAQNGAAEMIEQSNLTPEHLFGLLHRLKRDKIMEMACKARSLSRENAAGAVCDIIENVERMKKKPSRA